MKPIATCLPSNESVRPTRELAPSEGIQISATVASSLSSSPLAKSALETLWERMAEIYGSRFTSAYGAAANATWGKGLAGLSGAQVAAGLRACLTSADPWPPTLPQFRAMCLGIPEFAEVRAELDRSTAGRAPSAFARLAYSHLDAYRWRHADVEKADRLLREAYDAARKHVMEGGALPEEPAALLQQQEKPEPKPADPKVVEEALSKLASILGEVSDEQA